MDNIINVVNAIVCDGKDKVLLIKRTAGEALQSGKWAFPGGIVEEGEGIMEALARELREETGLELESVAHEISEYEYPREDDKSTKGKSYKVSVKPGELKLGEEVEDHRWATIEDIEGLDTIDGLGEEAMKALFEN